MFVHVLALVLTPRIMFTRMTMHPRVVLPVAVAVHVDRDSRACLFSRVDGARFLTPRACAYGKSVILVRDVVFSRSANGVRQLATGHQILALLPELLRLDPVAIPARSFGFDFKLAQLLLIAVAIALACESGRGKRHQEKSQGYFFHCSEPSQKSE
ncbi:hypothetical protein QZM18_31200 [Burkholderia diffusa]|uniref:hypothetical protein n=1 Tax=Burkholderia diffusa TaxID=488732 RepID=UPI00264AF127|nr:hypothetical protein [Burkholderia diffusa]MDN7908557.1 hypothetical protein [Burkholderia diffusa]